MKKCNCSKCRAKAKKQQTVQNANKNINQYQPNKQHQKVCNCSKCAKQQAILQKPIVKKDEYRKRYYRPNQSCNQVSNNQLNNCGCNNNYKRSCGVSPWFWVFALFLI